MQGIKGYRDISRFKYWYHFNVTVEVDSEFLSVLRGIAASAQTASAARSARLVLSSKQANIGHFFLFSVQSKLSTGWRIVKREREVGPGIVFLKRAKSPFALGDICGGNLASSVDCIDSLVFVADLLSINSR
ncbi:hypothetical protein TWF694_002256 [Orbilia ellipsospora]|uniref:Uncharacterized protein n=1 Tax=Orbilia ellipsospora TaxID=2528407 RepID=A0AAV9X1F2_9PEZI